MMKNVHIWGALVLLVLPLAAADLQLTQASVHAPSVERGSDITLTYTLVADNELSRVTTDVYLPGGINHQDSRVVNDRAYKHQQTFELPRSYDGDEEVLVRISAPGQTPITARIPLQSPSQRAAAQPMPAITSNTDIAVLVDPVRDVVPGDAIYYRAQIINTGDQPRTATVGLSDVSQWATYRVDPARTVQLAPGARQDVYIYLDVDQDAQPGVRYFDVTAVHDGAAEAATVKLAVLKPLERQQNEYAPWIIGAALLLLIAAIIFVAATYIKERKNDNNGGEDDDFVTYY